jgi:hypothetical protein
VHWDVGVRLLMLTGQYKYKDRFHILLSQQMHTLNFFFCIKGDIYATSAFFTSEVGTAVITGTDGEELKPERGATSVTVARTFITLNNKN